MENLILDVLIERSKHCADEKSLGYFCNFNLLFLKKPNWIELRHDDDEVKIKNKNSFWSEWLGSLQEK